MGRLPYTLFAAAAIALLALAGCGDDDDDNNRDGSPTTTSEETGTDETAPGASATPDSTIDRPEECRAGEGQQGLLSGLIFDEDSRQYPVGDDVQMTLRLTNCGENEATLYFASGQRYEFVVANNDTGEEIWRWSDGQAFTGALDEEVLADGEVIEYMETWDQTNSAGEQVPEGRYKVSAFSVGCGVPSEEPCQFGPIRQIDIGTETEQITVPPTEPG
jgi:Intracellular proteinase inhibitor